MSVAPARRETACVETPVVELAKTFESLSVTSEAWDDSVALLGGSIYMTWDWLRTWWQFYGEGRELRLYVCTAGAGIVGLIPLYLDQIGPRPFRLRVARLVGANIPSKVFDPPLARDWAAACLREVLHRSIHADRCDVVSLGPISATMEAWQVLRDMNDRSGGLHVDCDDSAVHTVFRLPPSHADYLKSLSKNEQKNRRKYELRTMRKAHDVEVSVISGPLQTLLEEFDRFVELHGAQWRPEGKPGHFGAWPDAVAYNRALVAALGRLGRVHFVRITADNTVVSSQYVFSLGRRWYWELPARLPGPEWERFSLGPSGIVTMVGEAISTGVRWIQGGLGHYDYKMRLGAEEHRAVTWRIRAVGAGSRFRQVVYDCLRVVVRFSYQKVWYRRIAPRLPAGASGSQWRLWLRLDF